MKNILLNVVQNIHTLFIFPRRTKAISSLIVDLLPDEGKILDIGCGEGTIDRKILEKKPNLKIIGIDIIKKKKSKIPVRLFDGKTIPYPDNYFDCILFIDTLHHTQDPFVLLREGRRVTSKNIIIKDHYAQTKTARFILKLMDWVGNKPHGVTLTCNYWDSFKWKQAWSVLSLRIEKQIIKLNLYPFPFTLIFDRDHHFIVKLEKTEV